MKKESLLLCGGTFVTGLIVGVALIDLVGRIGNGAGADQMFQTLKFTELGEAERRAFEAYLHESAPVAIYALSVSAEKIREAEQFGETRLFSRRILAGDLLLTHARLARIYDQTGQTNLAAQHFTEALQCAKAAGLENSITNCEALLKFVTTIDRNAH